jgi:hypothetical protein
MSTPTATININNILPNSIYVLGDDLLYSPNKMIPQNVLTSGSACFINTIKSRYYSIIHSNLSTQILHVLIKLGALWRNGEFSLYVNVKLIYRDNVTKLTWTASAAAYPAA